MVGVACVIGAAAVVDFVLAGLITAILYFGLGLFLVRRYGVVTIFGWMKAVGWIGLALFFLYLFADGIADYLAKKQ